jgi:hypothetical protein
MIGARAIPVEIIGGKVMICALICQITIKFKSCSIHAHQSFPMNRLSCALASILFSGCSLMPSIQPDPPATEQTAGMGDEVARCASSQHGMVTSGSVVVGKIPGESGALDALFWCTKAAQKGDARSQFVLAEMYEKGLGVAKNQAEAVRWYKASANRGYAAAQYRVGLMYGKGEGVLQDKNEATRWYARAAEQGHAEAQFTMGFRYEFGKGIAQNYTEAVRWYSRAADQGNSSAQNYLGVMSAAGHGLPQNSVEAYKWFNLAAVSGNREYITNRDKMAKKLSQSQLAEGQRLASEWVKQHTIR